MKKEKHWEQLTERQSIRRFESSVQLIISTHEGILISELLGFMRDLIKEQTDASDLLKNYLDSMVDFHQCYLDEETAQGRIYRDDIQAVLDVIERV